MIAERDGARRKLPEAALLARHSGIAGTNQEAALLQIAAEFDWTFISMS